MAPEPGAFACHQYGAAGQYGITLLVQDGNHHCATKSQAVTIDSGEPATCTILFSPTPVIVNETVNFTAVVTDPDGRVRRFSWNFGDGHTTSTSRNTTSHRYSDTGTFTVVLTITDDQGNVSTCNTTIAVSLPACPTITINPGGLPSGQVAVAYPDQTFTATGGASPLSFTFSGGLPPGLTFTPTAGGATLTGTPTLAGTYVFSVIATDADGCTGTASYTVTIVP
jgi:PKD repeat protein